jgi:hypothetical protein
VRQLHLCAALLGERAQPFEGQPVEGTLRQAFGPDNLALQIFDPVHGHILRQDNLKQFASFRRCFNVG